MKPVHATPGHRGKATYGHQEMHYLLSAAGRSGRSAANVTALAVRRKQFADCATAASPADVKKRPRRHTICHHSHFTPFTPFPQCHQRACAESAIFTPTHTFYFSHSATVGSQSINQLYRSHCAALCSESAIFFCTLIRRCRQIIFTRRMRGLCRHISGSCFDLDEIARHHLSS